MAKIQEIETLKAKVSEAGTEATNVSKLIAVTKKYIRIDNMSYFPASGNVI